MRGVFRLLRRVSSYWASPDLREAAIGKLSGQQRLECELGGLVDLFMLELMSGVDLDQQAYR